jgi:hypothetical protein
MYKGQHDGKDVGAELSYTEQRSLPLISHHPIWGCFVLDPRDVR